ncbi:carbamate kinase 1 [Peptococcaceae bacterium CEB3]|nr:carbamate kinase 1 [Peptococcaceae bacterium CEB3]
MKLAVIAIGGNSLIRDKSHMEVSDQYEAVCETAKHIAELAERGYNPVITHGNGPQVGFILRRAEIAYEMGGLHRVPLVSCDADTQGAIGYQVQQAMDNEFKKRGLNMLAATVVTQVLVAGDDPAFTRPSKPIGTFYNEEQAEKIRVEHPDWTLVNDAGRGYRRVVPSPYPLEIVELGIVERLARDGYCVVCAGGGGIPVVKGSDGRLTGVDAVIDKDFASSLLAVKIRADLLVISTGVPMVYLNFGKPEQKALDRVTAAEMRRYIGENHFAPGSMLPKVEAALRFLEQGGKEAIITNPESLAEAVEGKTGTHIYP